MAEVHPPQWDSADFGPMHLALQNRFGCSEEEAITRLQALSFKDYDLDTTISDRTPHVPLKWAVDKVKAKEYVQLWYFTTEGIMDAKKTPLMIADDTLSPQNRLWFHLTTCQDHKTISQCCRRRATPMGTNNVCPPQPMRSCCRMARQTQMIPRHLLPQP
jgi:hypothetical protein